MKPPSTIQHFYAAVRAYWHHSIRRKLIIGFSVAAMLFMLVSGYVQYVQQRDALYHESVEHATVLANALAKSSTSWVLANDLAGLQEVVSGLAGTADLERIFMLTRNGEVLASTRADEIGRYVSDPVSQHLLQSKPDSQVLVDQRNLVDVAVPVMSGSRHIGWARVELSRDAVNADLRRLSEIWLGFALMGLLLVVLIVRPLTRGLMSGLNQLMFVTAAVRHGHTDARAKVLHNDEVGVLAGDFNSMLDALAHEKALLRGVIDATPDLIFFKDVQGGYLGCNLAFTQYAGRLERDLVGKSDFDFFDHETAQFYRDKDRAVLERGHATSNEEWISYPDGRKVLMETLKTPFRGADGRILGLVGVSRNITERKANEAKIQRLSRFYAALSQCNEAIVRCASEEELFRDVCRAAVQSGGLMMAWIGLVNPEPRIITPVASSGEIAEEYLAGLKILLDADSPLGRGPTASAVLENQPFWCQDFQHDPRTAPWHERGAQMGIFASAALPLLRNGKVIGAFTLYAGEIGAFDDDVRKLLLEMAGDISFALDNFAREARRQQADESLKKNEQLLKSTLEILPVGVWIMNEKGAIIFGNPAGQKIWAGSRYVGVEQFGEYKGWWLDSGKLIEPHEWAAARAIEKGETSIEEEIEIECFDGTHKVVLNSAMPIIGSDGSQAGAIIVNQDITERKKAEERIQWLAHFDALTGLPNRTLFTDRINQAIGMAQRSGEQLAVLFLDLDHFKNINDTLGHRIGDELLVEVAQRLQNTVRDVDTVSRQGGDEFILVLPGTDVDGAAHLAGKLLQVVAQTCQIGQHELVVTPSIGIAIYPSDGEDYALLSQRADVAMYRAKQEGRNTYRFYTPEMQARSARNMQLESALRRALDRNQFQLYYQPQVSLHDGRIVGAEALLRWHHPELGLISPAEFIPIAEDTGLILPIGEWVLRTALGQLKSWMDAGLPPMMVAVNLSAVQFRHLNLPELVTLVLEESGVSPEYLELELTERVAMDDPLGAIKVMDDLHGRGVRMSIDDFGTGYSSLSYLKRFQVYKLKIDQSFVRNITEDPEDKAIVSAIISLAGSLGMQTIAEGVETAGQLAFLREKGCNEVQGYHYSQPLPAAEFEAFLRKSTR